MKFLMKSLNYIYRNVPHYQGSLIYLKNRKAKSIEVHISSFRTTKSNKRQAQIRNDLYDLLLKLGGGYYETVHLFSHIFRPEHREKWQKRFAPYGVEIISYEPRITPKKEMFFVEKISKIKKNPIKVNEIGVSMILKLPKHKIILSDNK